MTRSISRQSPDCSPSRPAPLPAREMSVQGNPPVTSSTAPACSRTDSAVTSLTSSHLGTAGQCFARTARHQESHSACPAIVHPARSRPRSCRPIPENRDSARGRLTAAPPQPHTRAAGATPPPRRRAQPAGRPRSGRASFFEISTPGKPGQEGGGPGRSRTLTARIWSPRGRRGSDPQGKNWWTGRDSNPRPPACKAGALPAELRGA